MENIGEIIKYNPIRLKEFSEIAIPSQMNLTSEKSQQISFIYRIIDFMGIMGFHGISWDLPWPWASPRIQSSFSKKAPYW